MTVTDVLSGRLAVCSWSLQPEDPGALVRAVEATGLRRVQLALDPLRTGHWKRTELVRLFEQAGLSVVSGMMGMRGEDYTTPATIAATGGVRPDATWSANLEAARANAELAAGLGLSLITFHAGFLPLEDGPERASLLERIATLAEVFAAQGVSVGLETGQESVGVLERFLDDLGRTDVRVNFDPANMLLYDRDEPLEALRRLLPRVVQVHVKDAVRPTSAGAWGEELPVGEGAVDWDAFCSTLIESDWQGDLVVEREAGQQRVEDVRAAVTTIRNSWAVATR